MWSTLWLGLRSLAWAIAMPGLFAGYVPWRYFGLRDVRVAALGPAQFAGLLLVGVGAALLAACILEFARSGRGLGAGFRSVRRYDSDSALV